MMNRVAFIAAMLAASMVDLPPEARKPLEIDEPPEPTPPSRADRRRMERAEAKRKRRQARNDGEKDA